MPILVASSCITTRPGAPAPAPRRLRSSSSTSSPATTAAGSRKCASSRAAAAPSPTTPAAIRPRTFPTRRTPIARRSLPTISAMCSTIWASPAPMWWGCRWVASPPCISGSATPSAPPRWWSRAAATAPSAKDARPSRPRSRPSPTTIRAAARRRWRRAMHWPQPGCSSRTRIRAAGPSFATSLPSIPRSALQTRSAATSPDGRRSTISRHG